MNICYGTYVFSKNEGCYGTEKVCQSCLRRYKKNYIKYSTWARLSVLPIFPIKSEYNVICPICGDGKLVDGKTAKQDFYSLKRTVDQKLVPHADYHRKSKRYDVWLKDHKSGEQIYIGRNLDKSELKKMKRYYGYSYIEKKVIDVK